MLRGGGGSLEIVGEVQCNHGDRMPQLLMGSFMEKLIPVGMFNRMDKVE